MRISIYQRGKIKVVGSTGDMPKFVVKRGFPRGSTPKIKSISSTWGMGTILFIEKPNFEIINNTYFEIELFFHFNEIYFMYYGNHLFSGI